MKYPLPESNFIWRRIYSYVGTSLMSLLLAWIVYRVESDEELTKIALWIILLLWFLITYYMIAPTAEQITRIIKAAKLYINVESKDKEDE